MFLFGKVQGKCGEIGRGMNGEGIRDSDLQRSTVLPLPFLGQRNKFKIIPLTIIPMTIFP